MATKATKLPKLSSILIREIGLRSVKEVTQVRTFQSKMLRCQWLLAAHRTEREKKQGWTMKRTRPTGAWIRLC